MSYLGLLAHSPYWSLEKITSGWNTSSTVKTYFHNSELQRQWAWELLGKLQFEGNENILDFGCGDGKVSAELARLLPKGKVTGIDISSEMLAFANRKFPSGIYPNLLFTQSNSLTFEPLTHLDLYDVIVSFCVFHQVKDPATILKNLKKNLKPSGKLVLVVPAGKNPAFFEAATQIFDKYQLQTPWGKNPSSNLNMRTLEGCTHILKESGYQILYLEMVETPTPFYDKEELLSWMLGTVTPNWDLPQFLQYAFCYDLIERMCELDPEIVSSEGSINFKLARIHVIAAPE